MAPEDDQRRDLLDRMVLIRQFEEVCVDIYRRGDFPGLVHASSGQEAASVGVCSVLGDGDRVVSTHRGHGHCIARGVEVEPMLAEIMGRTGGLCAGKGGSMHVADASRGMLGANGIVGGGVGIALGAAFSSRYRRDGSVAVAFIGEGVLNQGVLLETMNMASLWDLPLIYACENNGMVEYSRYEELSAGSIAGRAEAFGVAYEQVDGMDLDEVRSATTRATERARAGGGPTFLDLVTYRYHGHHVAEIESGYRTRKEIEQWRGRDPLELFAVRLESEGVLADGELGSMMADREAFVREVYLAVRQRPVPAVETAMKGVFADER